jgi:hypothetical protein
MKRKRKPDSQDFIHFPPSLRTTPHGIAVLTFLCPNNNYNINVIIYKVNALKKIKFYGDAGTAVFSFEIPLPSFQK